MINIKPISPGTRKLHCVKRENTNLTFSKRKILERFSSMSIFLQGNSYSFHLTGHATNLSCDKVGDKTIGNEEDGIFPFLFAA